MITILEVQDATLEGEPPAYWPASGKLAVDHLSARYSAVCTLMPVLVSNLTTYYAGWSGGTP